MCVGYYTLFESEFEYMSGAKRLKIDYFKQLYIIQTTYTSRLDCQVFSSHFDEISSTGAFQLDWRHVSTPVISTEFIQFIRVRLFLVFRSTSEASTTISRINYTKPTMLTLDNETELS